MHLEKRGTKPAVFPRLVLQLSVVLVLHGFLEGDLGAETASSSFDQASKLYEQGKFAEAAAGYEKLIRAGESSPVLYFNLGNAWFKADQVGRAIAAWRQAQQLAPRDPGLRFNLQFARRKVGGGDAGWGAAWERWLTALTLNEWATLSAGTYWLWFSLLALREARPVLKRSLGGYTGTAGVAAVSMAACLGVAAYQRSATIPAVVVVPEAIVRYGPLAESQPFYQLRDGSEVCVLDEKRITSMESWLQVQDPARRVGWLKQDQVLVLKP